MIEKGSGLFTLLLLLLLFSLARLFIHSFPSFTLSNFPPVFLLFLLFLLDSYL